MTDESRPYRMRKRAEAQDRTRLRITESAVHLHGTVGPARTTMSAVAEHAGVQRSTLYRHFPDEAALFEACSSHWAAANPPPDLGAWAAIEEPERRFRTGVGELYAYYARTQPMLENLIRDEAVSDLVRERFGAFHGYLDAARDTLMAGRSVRGAERRRTRAAIGHALAFSTWRSLVCEQRLRHADAVALAARMVAPDGGIVGSGNPSGEERP
jgi:AcrR family transcriptional regulator